MMSRSMMRRLATQAGCRVEDLQGDSALKDELDKCRRERDELKAQVDRLVPFVHWCAGFPCYQPAPCRLNDEPDTYCLPHRAAALLVEIRRPDLLSVTAPEHRAVDRMMVLEREVADLKRRLPDPT